MSTASSSITVGGIAIDVVYKDIKNLHIAVYPPRGQVRVAAPHRLDDEAVRLAVVHRLPWINKRRQALQTVVRQSQREMVTGESHYVWGLRHRLKVVEHPGRAHVEIEGDRLLLYVPPGTTAQKRRDLVGRWQREQLRQRIPALIGKWEPIVGREVRRWSIRRMKTKWGSCNRESGHICFNLELAAKHPDLLEYIAVHEMVHLLERSHNDRFQELMDGFLPRWRSMRDALNRAPLVHEEWRY